MKLSHVNDILANADYLTVGLDGLTIDYIANHFCLQGRVHQATEFIIEGPSIVAPCLAERRRRRIARVDPAYLHVLNQPPYRQKMPLQKGIAK